MTDHTIVHCTFESHADAILEIFNEAIVNSTALYDYKKREHESMVGWFAAKRSGGFPVIGMEDGNGTLLGFGSYGTFRAWPAYKYSVEHSVYVHTNHRGKGLGRTLMYELISAARVNGLHAMIGGIDATNAGSIALHEKLGFKHVGTLPQVGFKFGRWLDLAFYQLLLDTPANPIDGQEAVPAPGARQNRQPFDSGGKQMNSYYTIAILMAAGIALVVQNLLMVRITEGASTVLIALVINSSIGLIILSTALLARAGTSGVAEAFGTLRPWAILPGILGSFFVFAGIVGFQKVGAATTITVLVSSQLIAGLCADALKKEGPIALPSMPSLLGAALLILGAYLIARERL